MKKLVAKLVVSVLMLGISNLVPAQVKKSYPVKRDEKPDTWEADGRRFAQQSSRLKIKNRKAKNVILFIGDGMGISTITAARILEGQMRGESGEENSLSFENFPFVALSKTYSANQQTADSAPTASAMLTGLKTNEGTVSVNQNVRRGDYSNVKENSPKTFLEIAEQNGKSTGVVSTARLTHATPASTYSHSPDRNWESDYYVEKGSKVAFDAGFPDIARQLIEFSYGDGVDVAMGGGRSMFMPSGAPDIEYGKSGEGNRLDKRDLTKEWLSKYKDSAYVWNKAQFDAIDTRKTKHLLGLFEPSHMQYSYDRKNDKAGEPSLSEMTTKAIDILSNNKKGYFLMVEGGRIDHAHHDGNAYRALTDAIAFSDAIRAAVKKVNLNDTLIIVTADHSHTFTIAGYPARGNNVLGLVRDVGDDGSVSTEDAKDQNGKPYTTLGYRNGPGAVKKGKEVVLTDEITSNPDYKQDALNPLGAETHGGEDVAIFAEGANAWLVHGVMEENWIFHVMMQASRMKQ